MNTLASGASRLPTTRELCAAMTGVVPETHPGCAILRAALLLATVDTWITPDVVGTDHGDTGSEVLWDLGIFDIADPVRALLIDRINHTAQDSRLGPAVDRLARAWWHYRRTTSYADSPRYAQLHQQATAAVIAARAACTRLRRDLSARHTTPTNALTHHARYEEQESE